MVGDMVGLWLLSWKVRYSDLEMGFVYSSRVRFLAN